MPGNDWPRTGWIIPSLAIVAAITGLRLLGLALSNADIFVDEAQYWFWGQNLDFGYYSKPPLTAWVIRATTELSGSISPFWVRFPVPWFHGATALILGAIAARMFGAVPAIWVVASYVTLPIVAVGSILISTDTIMAPFFAAGLLFYLKLLDEGQIRHALLAGLMIGLAFMAKYAGIYFLLCAILAAIALPSCRISVKNIIAFLAVFLLIISPNIIWNLTHELTTVQHTLDNAEWVREASFIQNLDLQSLAAFIGSQTLAVGPVIFAAMFLLVFKSPGSKIGGLLWFSLPIILLVSVQALLSRAYGNWAFAAYFAGTVAAVPWLLLHARKWLIAGLVFNIGLSLLLPVLAVVAGGIQLNNNQPLLGRYMGRDELSQQIIDLAQALGNPAIIASDRGILADLFYTGHKQNIRVFSVATTGRAEHYYQQNHAFTDDLDRNVLFITKRSPVLCNGIDLQAVAKFDTDGGAYFRKNLQAYLVTPNCYGVLK